MTAPKNERRLLSDYKRGKRSYGLEDVDRERPTRYPRHYALIDGGASVAVTVPVSGSLSETDVCYLEARDAWIADVGYLAAQRTNKRVDIKVTFTTLDGKHVGGFPLARLLTHAGPYEDADHGDENTRNNRRANLSAKSHRVNQGGNAAHDTDEHYSPVIHVSWSVNMGWRVQCHIGTRHGDFLDLSARAGHVKRFGHGTRARAQAEVHAIEHAWHTHGYEVYEEDVAFVNKQKSFLRREAA